MLRSCEAIGVVNFTKVLLGDLTVEKLGVVGANSDLSALRTMKLDADAAEEIVRAKLP